MNQLEILTQQAIESAVNGQWEKAIELNNKIIEENPQDVESYLRLGFAYLQIGNLEQAKKAYKTALKIQPGNPIALNNLEKIKILAKKKLSPKKLISSSFLDPNLFINIPGKTKVVSLVNLGQIDVLAKLKIGEEVFLKIKKRRIEVRTKNNEYIGAFPDDISRRLIIFIKGDSKYQCFIKEVSKNQVEVFIKEIKKGKKLQKYLSFPEDLQKDLKPMSEDLEKKEVEEEDEEEIFDLEKLAEEIEEKEYYPETTSSVPDTFEEEEFEE